jgi:hypothetical protein
MKRLPKQIVPILATLFVMLFLWLSAVPLLSWYEHSASYQQLDDASFNWYQQDITNYSFEFDAADPARYPFRLPIRIHVLDGSFQAAFESDTGKQVDIGDFADVPSGIDSAFAIVAGLLEDRPYSLRVQYDALLHFPQRIEVQFSATERDAATYYLRSFRETDGRR